MRMRGRFWPVGLGALAVVLSSLTAAGSAQGVTDPVCTQVSQTKNLVGGKTITSSVASSTTAPGYPLTYLNDKNETTRWASVPTAGFTLTADLKNSYRLTSVCILAKADTTSAFKVQVSADGVTFTDASASVTTDGTSKKQLLAIPTTLGSHTGRYMRIVGSGLWHSNLGNSIWELGVYNTVGTTEPVARPLKVMPLGDSITLGNFYPGAYRVTLWDKIVTTDKLPMDFVGSVRNGPSSLPDQDVEAFSGWRTDQFNAKVAGWLGTYTPDVVLLQTGSSDLEQGASAATATSRLDTLLATMYGQDPKLMVVVSTTTPESYNGTWYPKVWQDYDAAIPGLVTKYKNAGRSVYLADMQARNFSFGLPDIGDGVHPTAAGYVKMTAVWYPVLKPLFYTPVP